MYLLAGYLIDCKIQRYKDTFVTMDYAIRVTCEHKFSGESVIDFCKKYFDEYLIVYEDPDDDCHNEHYHVHGITTVKMGTLKQQLSRIFPKMYSLKEADERNIQYICKGKHDALPIVVDYKGSQFEDIESYHQKYWEEFIEKNGQFDPLFKKRKLNADVLRQEVIDACLENDTNWRERGTIMHMLVDRYVSHGKNLNKYSLQSIVRFIQYTLAPLSERSDLARQLCEGM